MDETWWKKPGDLDADQKAIVALPLEGNHLVCGPPGSGKTNLLLLRAAYLYRAGKKNIVIITFNRMLREFLSSGATNYPFSVDKIQTFRSWGISVLTTNGIEIDKTGKFSALRKRISDALVELSKTCGNEVKFDCILLDEAQDYTVEEIEIMRSFSKEMFAVGDNRQRIYKADGSLKRLGEFCNAPAPLEYHYRNGTKICRLADGIMDDQDVLLDTSLYNDLKYPSTVKNVGGLTIADQVQAAVPVLQAQLVAYPGEWIGILAPKKEDVIAVHEALLASAVGAQVQLQNFDEGYRSLDAERPIVVTTLHSAKGLEFRAVHLMAMDSVSGMSNNQRLSYTAVTRAKTSLHIFHNGSLPGYIERGIIAVEGAPVAAPTIEDLFGDEA